MDSGDGSITTSVAVKFTKYYCKEAHKLLADHGLAPKLFYAECEDRDLKFPKLRDGPGLWIVVMEYIRDDADQEPSG